MKNLLFICSGNYYRSRTAELLFNNLAAQQGLDWRAQSKGFRLSPNNLGPISPHALAFCQRNGIDCDLERMPETATLADLRNADKIIALKEAEHRPMAREHFPDWEHKIEYWVIHDIDYLSPEQSLPELQQHVVALVKQLGYVSN